jgi:1-acyl-sn-glycerol-3-phosphate acyltransferase
LTATLDANVRPAIAPVGWLRIAVRLLAMLATLLTCVPLYYLWRVARLPNPWPRFFLGTIGRIAGVRVTRRGVPARRGAFLLSNHVSWMDVPVLSGASGTAFVAHSGLASVGLLKWLCEMNDTVFVARHDRTSIAAQIAQVREAISETGALTIFPEGTTSDGTGLLPFKSSLLSALDPPPPGIVVQPILLDYGEQAPDIAWVGTEHGLDNFLKILARAHPIRVTVHFLAPFDPAQVGSRKAIAAQARLELADALARN